MEYDKMMDALTRVSINYETSLQILSDIIGYGFTEALLKSLFDFILPTREEMAAESFLKAIDEVAAKLFFYKYGATDDVYYSRIEDFVHNYKMTPEEKNEY